MPNALALVRALAAATDDLSSVAASGRRLDAAGQEALIRLRDCIAKAAALL